MKRSLIILPWLTLIFGLIAGKALAAQVARPNILVIFVDDQCHRGIGYENPKVITPHLNRLAGEGLVFNRAYTASPICAASRASVMTGLFPQQHGVISLAHENFRPYLSGGERSTRTLANQLRTGGYHCALWGKSHIGDPQSYGFQEGVQNNEYDDRTAFREAEAFLDRMADDKKPFLLWLAPRQPHVPLRPAEEWLALYDEAKLEPDANFIESPLKQSINNQGRPGQAFYRDSDYTGNWRKLPSGPPRSEEIMRQFMKAYYATVSHLDDQVGRLTQRLGELGLAENTVIIYLSDNGYHLGNHGLGNKITMHEESVRVPMFIRWPQKLKQGARTNALVSSLDVYSTILDLAGVKAPEPIMGKSLLPLLEDPSASLRGVVFSECVGVGGKPGEGHRMARNGNWKYVLTDTDEEYLFDTVEDPFELKNLIDAEDPEGKDALTALREAMADWMKRIGDRENPHAGNG